MKKKEKKYYSTGIEGWWTENPKKMSPQEAKEKLYQVRETLEELVQIGESYAHFQSAQHTHKHLKKALKLLTNIS